MSQKVFIIDDDDAVRDSISMFFEAEKIPHEAYASADQFLLVYDGSQKGCLVADIRMPGLSGLELQTELNKLGSILPIIFITGHGDLPMAVEAMRHGAIDFLRKPINEANLLNRIQQAFESELKVRNSHKDKNVTLTKIQSLTEREEQVFQHVTKGETNKAIAAVLGISERTVEVHRSNIMNKMDAKTLAQADKNANPDRVAVSKPEALRQDDQKGIVFTRLFELLFHNPPSTWIPQYRSAAGWTIFCLYKILPWLVNVQRALIRALHWRFWVMQNYLKLIQTRGV